MTLLQVVEQVLVLGAILALPVLPASFIYKRLPSTASAAGTFQGLHIKLTGGFAAYFVLVLLAREIMFKTRGQESAAVQDFSTWTVTGRIQDTIPGSPSDTTAIITVTPPLHRIEGDGSFWTIIPVQRGTPAGAVTLDISKAPELPEVIHLARDPLLGERYRLKIDSANRKINILDVIHFSRARPYSPAPQP